MQKISFLFLFLLGFGLVDGFGLLPSARLFHRTHHAEGGYAARRRHAAYWRGAARMQEAVPSAGDLEISRFHISSLSQAEFHRMWDHPDARPCVVEGVFSEEELEGMCGSIVEAMQGKDVEYQLRSSETGLSELFCASFPDFMEECFDSDHGTSALLFDEQTIPAISPYRPFISLPEDYFGADIFEGFPGPVKPMGSCLIMGGEGSRSTLHADPYEWMGWNLCLEGSKLWTFADPATGLVDQAISAYRLEPNAWDGHSLSAGWQSDVDLYRGKGGPRSADWPSAQQLGTMAADDREAALRRAPELSRGTFTASAPIDEALREERFTQVVQKEGDLVMIPPKWWHQTYHMEPTIAIASQYANERTAARVYRHMLEWCTEGGPGVEEVVREASEKGSDGSLYVIRMCLQGKLGESEGGAAYQRLIRGEGGGGGRLGM